MDLKSAKKSVQPHVRNLALEDDYWLDPIFNVKTAVFDMKDLNPYVDSSSLKKKLEGAISVNHQEDKQKLIVNYCSTTTVAKKLLNDLFWQNVGILLY